MNEQIDNFRSSQCYTEIKEICDQFSASQRGNVEAKDLILEICARHKYSFHRVLHCKQVGAFPGNRGGEGVSWRRAHTRVMVIKTAGFSKNTIEPNAVAGEDNPFTREYAKFTAGHCRSHSKFANYKEEDVVVGAWGATHAMHGFSCVWDGVECDIDSLTKNGFMCKDQVCSNDPKGLLRDAIDNGVNFTIIRWVVHAALPMVADIIGGALNTVQQTSEGHTRTTTKNKKIYIASC